MTTSRTAPVLMPRSEVLRLKREISESRILHAESLRYAGWKSVVEKENAQLARITAWEKDC